MLILFHGQLLFPAVPQKVANAGPRLNTEEEHHLTALQCFKIIFPGSRVEGAIFIQFFKAFQRKSFRTEYFIKKAGKGEENLNRVHIPGGQL